MSAEQIHKHELADRWRLSYTLIRNLFKPDTLLSFAEQRRAVRRIAFQEPLLAEAAQEHCLKDESILLKIWLFCLRSHSPLLTTIVFRLQYWLKGHFMQTFLHL